MSYPEYAVPKTTFTGIEPVAVSSSRLVRPRFMNIPCKLRIQNGRVVMSDGSDATDYLRKWQKDYKLKDGEFVNVLLHETAVDWEREVWEHRNLMQAA